MTNITGILLLVLAAVIVGFAAGALLLLLLLRDRSSKPATGQQADTSSRDTLYAEEARLWRDRQSGRLLVELDGKMIAAQNTLSESERKRLYIALESWQAWLGAPSGPLTGAELPAAAPAAAAPLAPATASPAAPAPAAANSIVAQIDAILQDMVEGTALEARSIRLAEEPRHGVVVWVGAQRYDSIEAVPEAAIQAVIRGAVAKWEKRTGA